MEALKTCLNADELRKRLSILEEREEAMELALESTVQSRVEECEVLLDVLDIVPQRIGSLRKHVELLNEKMRATSSVADSMSTQVRHLDHIRARVAEASRLVANILALSESHRDARLGFEQKNYKLCAQAIGTYRHVLAIDAQLCGTAQQSSPNREFSASSSSSSSLSSSSLSELEDVKALREMEQRLVDVIENQLREAVQAEHLDDAVRCATLYSVLGADDLAFERYTRYLRRVIAVRGTALLARVSDVSMATATDADDGDDGITLSAVEALTALFRVVGALVKRQRHVVAERFGERGSAALFDAVAAIQSETDAQGLALLDRFERRYRVASLSELCGTMQQRSSRLDQERGDVDIGQLAEALDSIAVLSQRIELYVSYMRFSHAKACRVSAKLGGADQLPPFQEPLLHRRILELLNRYIGLEEYYMLQSVQRAINMDEAPSAVGKPSSMVEFVFLVLRSCTQRTVATVNVNAICAMLNIVNNCLGIDFKAVLQHMLTEKAVVDSRKENDSQKHRSSSSLSSSSASSSSSSSSASSLSMNDDDSKSVDDVLSPLPAASASPDHLAAAVGSSRLANANASYSYLVVLNNLEVSADYVAKLKHEIEQLVLATFKGDAHQSSREKLLFCLADLMDTARAYRATLRSNLEQVSKTIEPSIRPLIKMFQEAAYDLDERRYRANLVNDPFVEPFIGQFRQALGMFRRSLTSTNYAGLVRIVLARIIDRMEKLVMQQKRFTALGGLQLDADIRALVTHFTTDIAQTSIRGLFARIIQMASLLNLEQVDEVLDYWGDNSGHITWRLNPNEIRRILSRRIDFSPKSIAQLKL
jgi:conserved oligomeric Golgi complex subunit 4